LMQIEPPHSGHKFEIRCRKNFSPKNSGCVHRNGKNPQKSYFVFIFWFFWLINVFLFNFPKKRP
jgi:hypothetical protein